MNKEFVPYKIAKELKELGFTETCLGYYEHGNVDGEWHLRCPKMMIQEETDDTTILAPLRQQAFRWLMDKHRYIHSIEDIGVCAGDSEWGHRFRFSYWKLLDIYNALYIDDTPLGYLTYEDAQDRCLEQIIKKIRKNKK